MLDGARNALLGYLYQLLGTASVRVRDVGAGNDVWAQLFAQVGDGVVHCEEFGQDATVRPLGLPDRGTVAIQFKYSASTGKLIELSELVDMLFAFDRSRREAAAEGVAIDRYVLITNRGLNANAEQLVEEGRASPDLPDPLKLRRYTQAGKAIPENLRRLEPYDGDPDVAARAWHAVLRTLHVFPAESSEGDLDRLRRFAARYGVLDREWDTHLAALIGALVRETAAGRAVEISRQWLKKHLVGDPDAANLQFDSHHAPHISSACRTQLEERMARQHRVPERYYLPRDTQEKIRDQVASYPIVFVYGDGGCGKSLAVVQYLRSTCKRQLVLSEPAATATEAAIVAAVTDLRLPGRAGGGADRSLADVRARLNVANSGVRLLWTIDLDGIDEAPDRRAEIRHLINVCWAGGNLDRSPASLVATCRSSGGTHHFDQLKSDWLDTPEPDLVQGVGSVSVGEFLDEDLVDAARLLGGRPEQRIISALERDAAGGGADSTALGPPMPGARWFRLPSTQLVRAETLGALRHPVVWGGYASMGELERNGILDGHSTSLAALAEQLVGRFIRRCTVRRRWSDHLMLDRALGAAARSIPGPPPYTMEHWERACTPFLGQSEARMLYHESLSYGLTRREAGSAWRWRHLFVVEHLASRPDLRGK